MLTRSLGSFFRGKATPAQAFLAALLGGLLGFVPGFVLPGDLGGGFLQAPGLILGLVFLVLVLNANLALFGVVLLLAKLCSLLLPVSFAVGRVLVEGPLEPLFRLLVNAPIAAWFGLEYYATTGGLVLGACFGTVTGMLTVRGLAAFRRGMASVESGNERYQKQSKRLWVRFLAWAFFGAGKGKKLSYRELAERESRGSPIRIAGVVLVVLVAGGLFVFQGWFSTPLLTSAAQSGLTTANGATVDVGEVELDLSGGGIRVADLAIADSADLQKNLFAAAGLEARIDTGALLRRRFVVDQVRASGARTGGVRETPGELVTAEEPEPEPPVEPGQKTLEDYLKDAEQWQERLVQVRDWLEWFQGGAEDDTPPAERTAEERRQRIERDIETYGYARVAASHLREELPLVWIKSIQIDDIECAQLPGESLDLRITDLSTDAWLLPSPPTLSLRSDSDKLQFAFTGPSKTAKGASVDLAYRRLSVDQLFAHITGAGRAPLQGGTIDIATNGSLMTHGQQQTTIELPLTVELRDTTFAFAGRQPTPVEHLTLPLGVRGPVDNPAVTFENEALAQALLQAGKQELASFVQSHAGELLQNLPAVPGAEGLLDPTKSPEELLDAGKQAAEDAKKALEEARKKAEEDAKKKAEEEARKILPGGLRGLLPGGKNG